MTDSGVAAHATGIESAIFHQLIKRLPHALA